jgi:hypothetical protein
LFILFLWIREIRGSKFACANPNMPQQNRIDNPRAFQSQLERELVIGGVIVGLVVGIGLIYLIWGATPALTALACFVMFLGVVALVWGLLTLAAWFGNRE